MKKQLKTIAVIFALVIGAGAGVAKAQITERIKGEIPFSFYVRNKQLPAGAYTITVLNLGSGMMEIRSADGKSAAFFLTVEKQEKDAGAPTELIFHKYGEKVFLSEIVEQGERDEAEVMKSKMEKRLEKAASRDKEVAIAFRME